MTLTHDNKVQGTERVESAFRPDLVRKDYNGRLELTPAGRTALSTRGTP